MNSLSVRAKLTLGLGVLASITLVLGAAAYHAIVVIEDASHEIDRKAEERDRAKNLAAAVLTEAFATRGFLLSGDDKILLDFESAKLERARVSDELAASLKSEQAMRLAAEMKSSHDAYTEIAEREIEFKRESKEAEALDVMRTQALPAFAAADKATKDFIAELNQEKQEIDREQASDVLKAKTIIIGLCLAGSLLGVFVGEVISRSVSRAIAKVIANIQELASNDLSTEDLVMTPDEIGRAGTALNEMKRELRSMIRSIADTAGHVASASEQISSSAEQQAQSAAVQKDQTTQVAGALQEMNVTVQQVSENSARASEASGKAAETARHGGEIVDQTLAKMQVIAESVRSTALRIGELGKSSDQIGRIVGVINDIADQTNLLALNAAIEAARAGEQGRGFAVVADEVRKLAERTTTSTKEIAQMIQTVQQETKLAVGAMEEGTRQVEEGVHTTNKAGEALHKIITMSEQVGEMILLISRAAKEQSVATDHINQNMEQIASLVRESAAGAQQSAKACQDLSGTAFQLQQMVSNFKLDGSLSGMDQRHTSSGAGSKPAKKSLAATAG